MMFLHAWVYAMTTQLITHFSDLHINIPVILVEKDNEIISISFSGGFTRLW